MNNKKGFTLTEMMVVVLILAGLATIAYPIYTKVILRSRITEAISLGEIVREAQQRSLALNGRYFDKFTDAHATGRTRIIKSDDFTVKNGRLMNEREQYTVSIGNVHDGIRNGCIVVDYGPEDAPIFSLFMLVEDSRIWCEEIDERNGICDIVVTRNDELRNICERK